jgi:transposase-like protein
MTVREIQGFLAEMYAVEVSPDLISTVTDGIVAEVTAWQSRPLERMDPVVFVDALRVRIRDEATVRFISRWPCCPMGIVKSSGSGSSTRRARSSG